LPGRGRLFSRSKPALTTDSLADFRITAIVASTPDGVIGDDMAMPWRLSTDLKRFKKLTMGGALLMGRKTFDSIGRVLPGRQTIVLTRQPDWSFAGVDVANCRDDVFSHAAGRRLFVVGGGEIYKQWWEICEEIFWTRVWAKRSGDTRIDFPKKDFRVCSQMRVPAGFKDDFATDFHRLVRR
jgi:dihydrofolate reductase